QTLSRSSSMPLTRVEDHPECRGEGCSTETYCKNSAKGELCLDLSNQSLFSVPLDDASEPQYLQFVFLQNNHIKMLPSYFFQCLPKLRHLDLRENKLMEIPVSIAGHANLEVLLLQNNELSTLPCELGQVPRLRKLQFSGNPIIWPPGKILSEGLDAILSFLREAYMEQLGRGDMDVISKANDYGAYSKNKYQSFHMQHVNHIIFNILITFIEECTKDVQNYTDVTSADNKMKHQSQNSFTLYGEKCLPASSTLFGTLEGKGTESSVQYEIKEKSVDEISPLKGKSKQLKGSAPLRKGTIYKDVKAPPMRPVASAGHAQAIMNGQPFPLGYRKRTASPTTTKIYETLLKKLWLNQLKCVLQSQDKALQKQKTLEALRQWRQEARVLKQTLSHHNWSGKI
ncbi:Leucine-rich repeat-containing protein 27, partial [Frankliniella fusca]